MKQVVLEILNWEKYNPKRDQKHYSWLRLDNNIGVDPKLFGLSPGQKYAFILILCECSKANTGQITFTIEWLSHLSGLKIGEIENLLQTLIVSEICRLHDRARPPIVVDTTPTYERTNERMNTPKGVLVVANKFAQVPEVPAKPSLIFELWNTHRGNLPECKALSDKRKRIAASRWREKPDEQYWRDVILKIVDSKFCNGDNQRGWRADFDFLCRPDTHLKVLEGKYDGNQAMKHDVWAEMDKKYGGGPSGLPNF